jgi:hypothetical protein
MRTPQHFLAVGLKESNALVTLSLEAYCSNIFNSRRKRDNPCRQLVPIGLTRKFRNFIQVISRA